MLAIVFLFASTGCSQQYDERLICRYPIAQSRAEMALEILQLGNRRFVAGESVYPNQNTERRLQQAQISPRPVAAVLGCADPRVPVELIFDLGVGDLFTVRSAGNAYSVSNAGSLEYAVINLDVPLIVVMGHTDCGAVDAAWLEGRYENLLGEMLTPVWGVVQAYKKAHPDKSGPHDAEGIQAVTRANVYQCITDILANSQEIREKYEAGLLDIVPAEYDLATGKVTWLEPESYL